MELNARSYRYGRCALLDCRSCRSRRRFAQVQSTLVKAIARAHRWRALLENGVYSSAAELSAAECINPSYAARMLRLTLLAPHIVEAVLNGSDSPAPTLDRVMRPFPMNEQRLLPSEPPC